MSEEKTVTQKIAEIPSQVLHRITVMSFILLLCSIFYVAGAAWSIFQLHDSICQERSDKYVVLPFLIGDVVLDCRYTLPLIEPSRPFYHEET